MADIAYDLQKQLELLARAILGTAVAVNDYDDMANALHAQYAQIASVYVPDYSISLAWTDRLKPFEIVGYWRLPTGGQWEYYSHGQWYITDFATVKSATQSGAWPGTTPGFFHRTLYQSTLIADPNDPSKWVPNPVFLVPNAVPYF